EYRTERGSAGCSRYREEAMSSDVSRIADEYRTERGSAGCSRYREEAMNSDVSRTADEDPALPRSVLY
ncbi:MAG TPA: hypothetical protein VGO68_11405, partial [Pyrinomonadaceae bacterium]|nr:hypothetical protein [Pyrinomonadaceae bacterium]